MAASSSSHSSSEAGLSPTVDNWATEPWFREHQDQSVRFETERRSWAAGPAPAAHSITAHVELRLEDATNQYDDSSSDSSSETDSLASVESFNSERRRVQASLRAARLRVEQFIAHYERQGALAGDDEADDLDEAEDLQDGDGAEEPLPVYEPVETPPPDYVAREPQTEQMSLRELRVRQWQREQELQQQRQREEEQEWIRWAAESGNFPESLSESYELHTYETGCERVRAGRSSDEGFSSAIREDRETLEMSGGDGASGCRTM